MKTHLIKNNSVEVGVTEECGHLFPVRFFFGDKTIKPMHIAPWADEDHGKSIPPMLKTLRGDFFCAPFGASDILPDETRGHGAPANDKWLMIQSNDTAMKFRLTKKISGAELTKEISINEDEKVVYQRHIFTGGDGKIPVAHHAMLKVKSKGYLSFSDFVFAGTPPEPIETDPGLGRSVLKYPQEFSDLSDAKLSDGGSIDLSVYPYGDNHEDLFMVIAKQGMPFGWSAFSCPEEGWVWYSIKNISIFPNTVIWQSNGGRYYPPFSSRHTNVIGIEEAASYYHLGHKASAEDNDLVSSGYKTYIELKAGKKTELPYLFGVAEIPAEFTKVKKIVPANGGVEITDINGLSVKAKVNLNFIKDI